MRPDKEEYFLGFAEAASKRSTCLRKQWGAVIVVGDEIAATGYNGSPRGEENCCDTGICNKDANNAPHWGRYDLCKSVHAEANAIISAARRGVPIKGGTIYLAGYENGEKIADPQPCYMCRRLIKNAGLRFFKDVEET